MGLLNKLMNALFEEEEIEIDKAPEKIVIKDEEESKEPKKEVKKEIKTTDLPLENERELFKAENTFNFPDFDEEEFATSYEPVRKEEKPKKRVENERKKVNENLYDESKVKITREEKKRRSKVVVQVEEKPKKAFVPSPIISPVYGILDKNYKKEDLVKSAKKEMPKKIDVDVIRKKAFGTLEEDIEKTMSESVNAFYNEEAKNIDELLHDSIDDTIEINYADEIETHDEEDFTTNIEEELNNVVNDLNISNEKPKSKEKVTEEELENNTLENDLFDLIDSMYDNREDEEE